MHLTPFATALAWASLATSTITPSYRSDLLALHKSLVSIPSNSGLETAIGDWLSNYFTTKGFHTITQHVTDRENTPKNKPRHNVVAWPSRESYRNAKVMLTSHIDTVPPHIAYSIDDGEITKKTQISGRGSVDAKASVAAMIIALDELLAAKEVSPEDIMLSFVVGEEVSGDGMQHFSAHKPQLSALKSVIFGEPTDNKLACGHKGALFCHITAHGFGGHSGYPWLGKSATELIVRALDRILHEDLGSSEAYGNTTVNLGLLDGGVAENVIPERATAGIMVRVALGPQKSGGDVVKERIQRILDEVDNQAFDFECSQSYGFVKANCDVEGFEAMVANYGTDLPNLKGDYTKYLYGPGSILVAHGASENVTVGDMERAVEDYQRLILHALKSEGSDEL